MCPTMLFPNTVCSEIVLCIVLMDSARPPIFCMLLLFASVCVCVFVCMCVPSSGAMEQRSLVVWREFSSKSRILPVYLKGSVATHKQQHRLPICLKCQGKLGCHGVDLTSRGFTHLSSIIVRDEMFYKAAYPTLICTA
jgi:hypothetical protein